MDNVNTQLPCTWQSAFVEMIPEIQQRLRGAFRDLDREARLESIDEAVVHCLLAYVRLYERGRAEVATAATLAFYAALQVKRGRPAVGRMNGKEPLSRYGQLSSGIRVQRLDGQWIDQLVEDKRASIPDQVTAKLDFGTWLATLSRRMNEIARDLAHGFTTSEMAVKHGVTAGRISQMRRDLEKSWLTFQNEAATVA
jgi:hypothetical protein